MDGKSCSVCKISSDGNHQPWMILINLVQSEILQNKKCSPIKRASKFVQYLITCLSDCTNWPRRFHNICRAHDCTWIVPRWPKRTKYRELMKLRSAIVVYRCISPVFILGSSHAMRLPETWMAQLRSIAPGHPSQRHTKTDENSLQKGNLQGRFPDFR